MAAEIQKLEMSDGFLVYANPKAAMETQFIHKEIFQDKCYDVAPFPDDPFMIDAGGNIGMFSMYMKRKYPAARILAFEPAPTTFNTFKKNMELHDISGVQVYQCGLGGENASETLTFYPDMPGNSTLHGAEKEDFIKMADPEHPVVKLLSKAEQVKVDVKRLSCFLDEVPDLKRIDLLKIDVEGAELDVFRGLDDAHWDLIDNIALEICDNNGALAEAEALLQKKGFGISKELADWAPKEMPMYMMIAKRAQR